MVSDAFADPESSASVPTRYFELELMVEWGLTEQEFDSQSEATIQEIIEYRQAKADGEKRYQSKQK